VLIPTVSVPEGDARQRLFDRRTVMVSGALDHEAASTLCAQLMALDGESIRDVDVILNSPGGPLDEVSAVLDVIGLMRATVNTTCIGTAKGTAGIVLACGTGRRRAAPNATISVRCERAQPSSGTADDLARRAAEDETLRRRLHEALVAATGQPAATLANEFDHGGVHGASEAQALGLIDDIGGATN